MFLGDLASGSGSGSGFGNSAADDLDLFFNSALPTDKIPPSLRTPTPVSSAALLIYSFKVIFFIFILSLIFR